MALNSLKCNHLTPRGFNGSKGGSNFHIFSVLTSLITYRCSYTWLSSSLSSICVSH